MRFYEAKLMVNLTDPELADVYKKAIEGENERYLVENPIYDSKGELISNEIKTVWSGNYVHAEIIETYDISYLSITAVSRTQPNVEQFIKQYEREGAKLVKKNF